MTIVTKDNTQWELTDVSNGSRAVPWANKSVPPDGSRMNLFCKYSVRLRKYKLLINAMASNFEQKIPHELWQSWKHYHILSDIVKCEPGYKYAKHADHETKLVTMVVYMDPDHGDGTTLYDTNDNEYKVEWRRNRAIIFTQSNPPRQYFHYYLNTLNTNRYTLNVYLTDHVTDYVVNIGDQAQKLKQ